MKLFNLRHTLSTICSSFLALLGFSSCSESALMYGMPTGSFVVKGAVTDEDGNEVRNAEIRVTYPEAPSGIYCLGESTTDSKGNYEIKGNELLPEIKVVCIPETSDLQPDSVNVKMKYKDADKHDSWDYGHADASVNFILKSTH